jgi:hypothetical protein
VFGLAKAFVEIAKPIRQGFPGDLVQNLAPKYRYRAVSNDSSAEDLTRRNSVENRALINA